jgi:hypothetical protein
VTNNSASRCWTRTTWNCTFSADSI